ncbi:penicillin acylase family protein [soil metagenome]
MIGSALLAGPALAAGPAPEPYGTHDAGGFRNILPPGANGTDNAAQLGAFTLTGQLPPHWDDQKGMYEGLVKSSARSDFGMADVNDAFKDATFGVKSGQSESTISPRAGVTIVRDSAFGVPHIYGVTRSDAEFGAGYAGAQDRLFLMDILRHTGKATLSSFIGGSPGNRAMDQAQWAAAPYTDADLQEQVDHADDAYGADGAKLVDELNSYVAGINAYIDAAATNPTLLPAEYAALGKNPQHFTDGDVVATASLIGGIFGRGGGAEVRSAQLEQAFVKRFGKRKGKAAWQDFRSKNDPEAPVTVLGKRFPYEQTSPFAKRGLAMPKPGTVKPAPVTNAPVTQRQLDAPVPSPGKYDFGDVGAALFQALKHPLASNWELVSGKESTTGHPIGVLGPQVGYYQPQILSEIDIHGPGIDARGATFPGVGLYVLLGHGRYYAWSATTATSDNVDTFAEVLCRDKVHYRYKGRCLPMETVVRQNSWTPNGVDMTPPGSETLTAYRTVHGIVYARGKVGKRKVAFVTARSTYFHEADSALFFRRMNNPNQMKNPKDFQRAAKDMNFAFNWSYIDRNHTSYQLTGWYPQRAKGTSPDFPVLGTGKYDWKGFKGQDALRPATFLPQSKHPHVVDQKYAVSWNNKQAKGWSAADDKYAFSSIYRSQMIEGGVKRAIRGSKKISLPELVQAMEEPATQDVRGVKLLPIMFRAIGKPKDAASRAALAKLKAWQRTGSHRRDLDGDGHDEMTSAITLMDAWYPKLVAAEFKPTLGGKLYKQTQGLIDLGAPGFADPVTYPSFADGWYGFVSKDLRDTFGPKPKGAYSRGYCGKGSKSKCRRVLRRTLRQATKVSAAQVYGYGDCASTPEPACWDKDRATHTSAISTPELIFQNRPTFQQTVSVGRNLP